MTLEMHARVAHKLRLASQRYTTSRRRLVDLLTEAGRPLTIPDVLHAGADIPQSSVYRNLADLEGAGVVHRVVTDGDFARYELAEDLTQHHHHLICRSCGGVEDFTMSSELEAAIEKAAARAARAKGFDPHSHRLDLIGLCERCGD